MNKRIFAALSCGMLALALSACKTSASFEQFFGSAKAELNELNGSAENGFELPYSDIAIDVELESGTVDIEIDDAMITYDEDGNQEDYINMGPIFNAEGVTSGERVTFTDDDGIIILRVTSNDGATGTLTFAQQ